LKILVSGHTSAIGNKFVTYAISQGHEVEELGSNLHGSWRLGDRLPKGLASEGFVHFAHDRSRSLGDMSRDIELIFEDFHGHPVLISTVSAHKKSKSRYGKSKFIAEDLFLRQGGGCSQKWINR
jgi:nucleoside-diphosphate-sugar epimerase